VSPELDLAVIWIAVYLAVIAARYTRLTPVLFYLFFGAVFVNLGILPIESDAFVRGFAEIGIVVIMFALGFEEQTGNFVQSIKRSWGIALFGAIVPFLIAYYVALYYWHDVNVALMCGLAMTATAVSLTMVSLRSEGLQTSAAATRVMTSAVLDDIASLVLVAIMVPIATGRTALDIDSIVTILVKSVAFFVIVSALGAWIFPHRKAGWFARVPLLGRLGFINVLAFERGQYATLAVLLLAVGVGLLALEFGFHPAVGAYMAGLILREEYFEIRGHPDEPTLNTYHDTKRIIDNVAFSWIGPVFFVDLGTKLVFDTDTFIAVIPQTCVLTFGLFIGQIVSAALPARFGGGMNWSGSWMIGFGMLGRGELAFVVMDIAYVQNQILNREAFYTLMFTAFWLNVAVPIAIRLWKPIYLRELEQARARKASSG
jgi:Na+:H+ antiporter